MVVDIPGIAHQVVAELRRGLTGRPAAEHGDELIVHVLTEGSNGNRGRDRNRARARPRQVGRVLGPELAARLERREGALRRKPDSGVAGREKLLGAGRLGERRDDRGHESRARRRRQRQLDARADERLGLRGSRIARTRRRRPRWLPGDSERVVAVDGTNITTAVGARRAAPAGFPPS